MNWREGPPWAKPKVRALSEPLVFCGCVTRRAVLMPWRSCSECGEFVPVAPLEPLANEGNDVETAAYFAEEAL